MNKIFNLSVSLLVIGLATSSTISAATIDFTGIEDSFGPTLTLPEATIINTSPKPSSSVFDRQIINTGVGAAGEADGFCFFSRSDFGRGCENDGEILFTNTVSNLSFDTDAYNSGDSVEISAYNGITFLTSVIITDNQRVDLSGAGDITKLVFDDSSNAFGFGYSTFSYTTSSVPVPVPASAWLFGSGLLGLVGVTRRKKV